jgi:hypothetical protein
MINWHLEVEVMVVAESIADQKSMSILQSILNSRIKNLKIKFEALDFNGNSRSNYDLFLAAIRKARFLEKLALSITDSNIDNYEIEVKELVKTLSLIPNLADLELYIEGVGIDGSPYKYRAPFPSFPKLKKLALLGAAAYVREFQSPNIIKSIDINGIKSALNLTSMQELSVYDFCGNPNDREILKYQNQLTTLRMNFASSVQPCTLQTMKSFLSGNRKLKTISVNQALSPIYDLIPSTSIETLELHAQLPLKLPFSQNEDLAMIDAIGFTESLKKVKLVVQLDGEHFITIAPRRLWPTLAKRALLKLMESLEVGISVSRSITDLEIDVYQGKNDDFQLEDLLDVLDPRSTRPGLEGMRFNLTFNGVSATEFSNQIMEFEYHNPDHNLFVKRAGDEFYRTIYRM